MCGVFSLVLLDLHRQRDVVRGLDKGVRRNDTARAIVPEPLIGFRLADTAWSRGMSCHRSILH